MGRFEGLDTKGKTLSELLAQGIELYNSMNVNKANSVRFNLEDTARIKEFELALSEYNIKHVFVDTALKQHIVKIGYFNDSDK